MPNETKRTPLAKKAQQTTHPAKGIEPRMISFVERASTTLPMWTLIYRVISLSF